MICFHIQNELRDIPLLQVGLLHPQMTSFQRLVRDVAREIIIQ